MKKIVFAPIALVLMFPLMAAAGPIVRGGESVSVDASQTLDGDFYSVGSSVQISGTALEDVHVAGGKVTVNGVTAKDLTILGGTVQVHGAVGDDLRVVGGDVVLGSSVAGDVVVLGGSLTILSTAKVSGDVLFWGGSLLIEGPVAGVIHGSSETIRIDAAVGGVEYTASKQLTLGSTGQVTGDIIYTGSHEIVRAQGAVVEGTIQHIERSAETGGNPVQSIIIVLATCMFSALALYFVARRAIEGVVTRVSGAFGLYGLIGIATCILVPILSAVLFVSVVGAFAGLVLLMVYIASLLVSGVAACVLVGHLLQKFLLRGQVFSIATPVIGAVGVFVMLLIPVLGALALFALTMCVFGAFVHAAYTYFRVS